MRFHALVTATARVNSPFPAFAPFARMHVDTSAPRTTTSPTPIGWCTPRRAWRTRLLVVEWCLMGNTVSLFASLLRYAASIYDDAQAGLIGLAKPVAIEVAAYGITCNTIYPGYVNTPLVDSKSRTRPRRKASRRRTGCAMCCWYTRLARNSSRWKNWRRLQYSSVSMRRPR